jgi:hypothetical protein
VGAERLFQPDGAEDLRHLGACRRSSALTRRDSGRHRVR